MSIQSEINRISGNISDAYDSIGNKGGVMPAVLNSDNLATAISTIQTGGVDDVQVDGTSVVSNRIAEIDLTGKVNTEVSGDDYASITGTYSDTENSIDYTTVFGVAGQGTQVVTEIGSDSESYNTEIYSTGDMITADAYYSNEEVSTYGEAYINSGEVALGVYDSINDTSNSISITIDGIEALTYGSPYIPENDSNIVTKKYVDDEITAINIPTKTSDLTNDGDGTNAFLTQHQSLSAYRTSSEQDIIDSGKQDTISDLSTIRSNASDAYTKVNRYTTIEIPTNTIEYYGTLTGATSNSHPIIMVLTENAATKEAEVKAFQHILYAQCGSNTITIFFDEATETSFTVQVMGW